MKSLLELSQLRPDAAHPPSSGQNSVAVRTTSVGQVAASPTTSAGQEEEAPTTLAGQEEAALTTSVGLEVAAAPTTSAGLVVAATASADQQEVQLCRRINQVFTVKLKGIPMAQGTPRTLGSR